MMRKDLVFIGSASRTGTQFLGHGLSEVIEDCFSVHEPDMLFGTDKDLKQQLRQFGLWHMVVGRLLGLTGVRVIGQQLITNSIAEGRALARIRRSRARYHASIRAPLIVESNGPWWYFAGHVQKIWPGAKVIGVIRDPRTWIRSCINKGARYDRRDWVDILPPGRLTPAKLGQRDWAERWQTLGTLGKLAWEWVTTYSHLSAVSASDPHTRVFRFEDLFAGGRPGLSDLVLWAAAHEQRSYRVREDRLREFGSIVRNASRGAMKDWPQWDAADARLVDELCGPLMREYGYGLEPEWLDKLAR